MGQIQCVAVDNGSGGTSKSSGSGHFIAVAIAFNRYANTKSISNVTDNLSQSYSYVGISGNGTWENAIYYKENSAAGVTTITVTFDSSTECIIYAMERDDILTSSSLDVYGIGAQNDSTVWGGDDSELVTTNANDFCLVSASCSANSDVGFTIDSPWSPVTGDNITSGRHGNTTDGDSGFLGYYISSTAGSNLYSGDTTISGNIRSIVAYFKLATTGIYRPSSDITDTGWTNSTGANSWDLLNETSYSDADYIVSPTLEATTNIVMGLDGTMAAGTYTIRLRGKYSITSGQFRVILLNSSDTVQGTSSWQAVTGTYATYSIPITITGDATRIKIEVKA
jgi:hypothetical protein